MLRHITPLRSDGILSFETRRYHGRPIIMSDGSEVKAGDAILELHLNSTWFKQRRKLRVESSRWQWEVLNYSARDLRLLAQKIASGMLGGIAALHGSTLLHVAARRLGFQVETLPNTLWKKCARFYIAGLMRIHHLGRAAVPSAAGKSFELKEVWLSRSALLRKYGEKPDSYLSGN